MALLRPLSESEAVVLASLVYKRTLSETGDDALAATAWFRALHVGIGHQVSISESGSVLALCCCGAYVEDDEDDSNRRSRRPPTAAASKN